MKRLSFLLLAALSLVSCTDSIEDKASVHLLLAEQAYNKGAYTVAREQIDSIRLRYPKAFNTRRAALELRLKVDLAEGQQAVEEADKIILQKTGLVERMKGKMVLEPIKGTVGNYVAPAQTMNHVDHTMLRAQVDEHGLLTLTSVFVGNLKHKAIRVECEGQKIQTSASAATYKSVSHGKELECAVFSNDCEVGVSAFISQHVGKEIKLTFLGETRQESIILSPADVQAVAGIYDLYLQMKLLNDARVRYADACEKVKFLHRKMDEGTSIKEE